DDILDDTDGPDKGMTYGPSGPSGPGGPGPTKAPANTTTLNPITAAVPTQSNRPSNPSYVKKNISGLICHTVVDSYINFEAPDGCDFFIADVEIAAPAKHPLYSPYMASVSLKYG
ncbi:hypothetical protein MTO96_033355, partial [Rhipicephalus appendiculatus]